MAKRWYIIHAYSNFENKVADSIREQAKHRHLDHLFEEIIVPTEKLVDVRHGQKHATERKFFPGYVLAKMDLTDEAYHLIRNTPKVTGFLGSHKKPIPISDAEAAHILHQIQEGLSGRSLRSLLKWASRSACRTAHSLPSMRPSKRSTILDHGSRLPSRSLAVRRQLNLSLAKYKKSKPTFCPD